MCTTEVIGEDVTRVLSTMEMVSTNVEDIKSLIERLSGQFKNVDNALSHTGSSQRRAGFSEPGVMHQRYLASARSFLGSPIYADSASRLNSRVWESTTSGSQDDGNKPVLTSEASGFGETTRQPL